MDAARLIYAQTAAEVANRGESAFTFGEDQRRQVILAGQWLTDSEGRPGLMLQGSTGNGKTTMARSVARVIEWLTERELGRRARIQAKFITAREVCELCIARERRKDKDDEFRELFRDPLLVIDDLGDEPKEVLVYGMPNRPVADLLAKRYDLRLMTVTTTNLTGKMLEEKYGERTYDRIRQMFQGIPFEGASFRKQKQWDS